MNHNFASSNTQIILDSRLPILDNNGNAEFDKRLGNNPVIGTIINGPFIQPGTTVTAIENTNNNRQIITLSKPLLNPIEKNNQIFIYTFNDSTPPKPPSAPKPPAPKPQSSSPTEPSKDTDDSVDSSDSEQVNLFTSKNIIIGIVVIFMIIIIIVLLSK